MVPAILERSSMKVYPYARSCCCLWDGPCSEGEKGRPNVSKTKFLVILTPFKPCAKIAKNFNESRGERSIATVTHPDWAAGILRKA